MKKTYASLLAAGALVIAGGAFAVAEQAAPAVAAVNAVADAQADELKSLDSPDLTVQFYLDDEKNPYVDMTIIAPLQGSDKDWKPVNLDKIDRLVVYKTNIALPESEQERELVVEYTDVAPGSKITFTDTDVAIGQTWEYRSFAYVGETESSMWGGYMGAYIGLRPNAIDSMSASAEKGHAPVSVTFVVPDGYQDPSGLYGDFDYKPTQIVMTRQFSDLNGGKTTPEEEVWTLANPVPGETYTFVDDNNGVEMPEGDYSYHAYVVWEWGTSFAQMRNVVAGLYLDVPGNPDNVVAVNVPEGAKLTWDAPTQGAKNGYVDPEKVTYTVARVQGYNDEVVIAEDVVGTEYVDDLEGIESQCEMKWKITAKNEKGSQEWGGATSNSIIVGPACQLPFEENFGSTDEWGSKSAHNMWISENLGDPTSYMNWYVADKYSNWSDLIINPSNPDNGVAYAYFSEWTPVGNLAFTTGDIDFKGHAQGEVTISYYGSAKGYANLAIDIVRRDVSNNPEEGVMPLSDDEEVEAPYETIWDQSTAAPEDGWKQVTVPFEGFASSDKIKLRLRAYEDDAPESGVYMPVCVEYVKLAATDEYSAVEGLPAVGDVVSTQYYNLQGVRVAAPVKGETVIRRSVLNNGTVKADKILVK